MKFAFCLFNYFPFGGLQRDFLRIAELCHQRGHTVEALAMHWEGGAPEWLLVRVFPNHCLTNHGRCRAFSRDMAGMLRNEEYDLVVGFDKMPGLDVYFAADPCFQARAREIHSRFYRLTPRYRHFVAFERSVFDRRAETEILLLSEREMPHFIRCYRTPLERFHMLPAGVSEEFVCSDHDEELRASFRQAQGIASDQLLLLFVGSRFATKGLDRALRAIAALPLSLREKVQLFVVGDDDARSFIAMARTHGIERHIRFWGGCDNVRRFFLAADLLIHPAYTENAGIVLLEALILGLPVLTTDVCGYAYYIAEAHAGMVLPSPFSQTDMNGVLERMLTSPEKDRWSHNGREYGKRHDFFSLHTRAAELIEKCAEHHWRRRGM